MKWNCNIVKEMYDRVLRRKFGVLCIDDKSNENFINSYLNRLDCKPINLQCLKGADQPCSQSSTSVSCNLQTTVDVTIQPINYCPVDELRSLIATTAQDLTAFGWRFNTDISIILNSITTHPNYTGGVNVVTYKLTDNTGALVGGYLPSETPGTLQFITGNALTVYKINPAWTEVYFTLEIEAEFNFGYGNHTIKLEYSLTVPQPVVNTGIVTYNVQPKCEDLDEVYAYFFTASTVNGVPVYQYNWKWDNVYWTNVTSIVYNVYTNQNVLILIPTVNIYTDTDIIVTSRDANQCTDEDTVNVVYLGGCTDPEAVNYNSNATFDNGTCYYTEFTTEVNWECEPDDTGTVCVTVNGGVPPYTVVGTPNGTILTDGGTLCQNLPNGTNFSVYTVDSNGNITDLQTGTIDCPFNCMFADIKTNYVIQCLTDGLGNNTGQATLTLNPSGGNAPYIITGTINGAPGFTNGQIVNHGDKVDVLVTDVNGCTFAQEISISCPVPEPGEPVVTCEDIEDLTIATSMNILSVTDIPFVNQRKVDYRINYQFTNLITLGLTIGDIIQVEYTLNHLTPITPGTILINHYPDALPASPCNPCVGFLSPIVTSGFTPTYTAVISGSCSKGPVSLQAQIHFKVTVMTSTGPCVKCFKQTVSAFATCGSSSLGGGVNMINVPC